MIPEFWECDMCGGFQTHQTHVAKHNKSASEWSNTFFAEKVFLCDTCFEAVGGTCDVQSR